MPAPIIPWEPANIPEELQDELNRRKTNRSLRYVENTQGNWDSKTGDWSKYRGPMSPWVRFCSNSNGPQNSSGDYEKPGFVFYGGKGFYSDYGFSKNNTHNPSIIGYAPSKGHNPHTIDNDLNEDYPIHVPAPEIERIHVTIQKELYRLAVVEWVCFSKKQLEYMTPYFLVPGITCTLEWGWNLYNPVSLVDLTDTERLKEYFNNPYPLYTENILKSRGNYDVIFGIIWNFEWVVDGNKFRCKTEILSKDRIYAGLIVDATAEDKSPVDETKNTDNGPFNNLIQFFDKSLDQFRNVLTTPPEKITALKEFTDYVRDAHKEKGNADEYLYGVFYGRDLTHGSNYQDGFIPNVDFDRIDKHNELWLNLGLVIEAINFHARPLKGVSGKEMLRVDIDDVVIGAHPNMISSDGSICLIPNFESPKYFYGTYGPTPPKSNEPNEKVVHAPVDFPEMRPADIVSDWIPNSFAKAKASKQLANLRLIRICKHRGFEARRDDIDQIINAIRYVNKGVPNGTCSFPSRGPIPSVNPSYPPHYSGYLRHIYVNLSFLKGLLNNSDVVTYYQFVEKILAGISSACGNFWDFRLVSASGDKKIAKDATAPMKVVDYKFMYSSNRGSVWAFDYFAADSLLLGVGFKPTLSTAQAIRTIYGPVNNVGNITTITNGNNEVLDFKATDRLKLGENEADAPTLKADKSGFIETMRTLQQKDSPCKGSYQIASVYSPYHKTKDVTYYRRLALPAPEILQLLLDDSDEENNPKYTGIMPGIQATFTIQGIGGLRTFMMFLCRGLPEPYSEKNIVFRIVDVHETIEAGKWTTQITAGVIPLRQHIKDRLGLSGKAQSLTSLTSPTPLTLPTSPAPSLPPPPIPIPRQTPFIPPLGGIG